MGAYGSAWSSAPYSTASVNGSYLYLYLYFYRSSVNPEYNYRRSSGFPVRCARQQVGFSITGCAALNQLSILRPRNRAGASGGVNARGPTKLRKPQQGPEPQQKPTLSGASLRIRGRRLEQSLDCFFAVQRRRIDCNAQIAGLRGRGRAAARTTSGRKDSSLRSEGQKGEVKDDKGAGCSERQ